MKRKITAILFAFIAMISALLAFSCSNFDGKSEENEQKDSAYISLKVDGDVRTARPDYELSEFTKFELLGKLGDAEEKSLKTWSANQETEETAYALMAGDHLQIAVGSWIFRLRATAAGDVIYEGSDTVQVESGDNTIDFTLDLAELPSTGIGGISVKVVVTQPGDLSLVVAELYKNGETPELVGTMQIENKGTVEFSDLNVGSYTIDFSFYADEDKKILLGKCPENAIVVPGKTSSSLLTLDSLDSAYTITYHLGEELSQTAKYTRHAKVVLPDSSAELTQKEGFVFCGWYASEDDAALDSSASAVTEIPVNTVGNKNYWPRFISVADTAQIKTVAVEGTLKVSKTVKAVPYTKETDFTEDDKFTGEIASYKWYVGEDSNGDGTIDEWSEVAGKTDSEYTIGPEDLGKTLRVEIVQKYYAVEDTEKNIYTVKKDNAAVSSSTEKNPVTKGILPDGIIKAEYSETITVGNTPSVEKVIVKDYDDEPLNPGDAPGKYTAEIQNNEALASSNKISVKITLYGFEDVIMQVFVTVKAAQPSASLRTDTVNIDDNKVAFVTPLPSGAEYSTDGGENWTDIAATPFTPPAENGKILVRTKASGTAGEEGYIAESDSIEISVTNENLGTLVKVNSLSFGDTALKFGNTVTVSPGYTVEGHIHNNDVDGTLSYQWYYGSDESWTAITGETGNTYTIGTTSALNKKLKVIIIQNHPNLNAYTAENVTSGTVEKGTLVPSGTLVYDGENTVVVGADLDASKLSGLTFTNQAGVSVTPALSFSENAKAPSETGDVIVKANLAGYNECSCTVVVKVRAAAPASIGTYLASGDALGSVSLGFIKFTQMTNVQYSTAETAPESDEGWTNAPEAEFPAPAHLYLRIKAYSGTNGGAIASSVASSDFAADDGLASYKGKRCVVVDSVTVQTGNNDITVSCSGKTVTATVPAGVTVTNWEILNETLGELATVSEDKSSLSFKDNAEAGNYTVIVWATRGNNTLNATCLVKISSASGD